MNKIELTLKEYKKQVRTFAVGITLTDLELFNQIQDKLHLPNQAETLHAIIYITREQIKKGEEQ